MVALSCFMLGVCIGWGISLFLAGAFASDDLNWHKEEEEL